MFFINFSNLNFSSKLAALRFIDIFNLLQNSPIYTGPALTVTDHEGNLVSSSVAGFEGGRLATTVAEGATLGPELITAAADREFSSDTGFWTKSPAGVSIIDGVARFNNAASAFSVRKLILEGIVIGKKYQVIYEIKSLSLGGFRAFLGAYLTSRFGAGIYTEEFVAVSSDFRVSTAGESTGDIDNISVREVIPTWYDTDTEGAALQTSVNIPTKAGTRKWYTEPFDGPFGYSNWPARTNLFLNSNAPVTQNITTTAQAYTISVLGTGDVTVSGTASGTATAGSPLTVTATAGTLTCTVTGTLSRVQVEAGAFASPWIETLGTTVTRPATNLSLPTAGVLPVNDFGIWGEVIPGASGQALGYLLYTYTAFNEEWGVYAEGTKVWAVKKVGGGINYYQELLFTHTKDTPFQYMAFQSRVYGMGIRVKEQGGAWSAWTLKDDADGRLDALVASTYQIGARNNANHFAGTYPGLAIIQHQDPKAELERLVTLYGGE